MSEVDPEVLRAYHEARARETAEALIRTDAKPDHAEQAKQILQDDGPKQAAELKKEDVAATSDTNDMTEERRASRKLEKRHVVQQQIQQHIPDGTAWVAEVSCKRRKTCTHLSSWTAFVEYVKSPR
ncbi:hypothetical protein CERZMDRAFT_101137 [Cercospora zeae-maydis SCOH1-5]|uniref:Uncharacterized protein n=1 Tax=Cercospora zeae-maydis SCOH1-5 TaxID=717836 RepID=A0A6A6F451_9PEZI|nr:hypothetical protein CERZMDRAFT_101137 [Cercospora zeae-maydis SCOH1-5]